MSNDVSIFTQQMPAHLAANADANAAMNSAAATGTVGGVSVNKLSLKGSKFRLVVGGEELKVLESNSLDLVFLRANEHLSKAFYATAWKPGQDAEAPDCASDNGVTPRNDSRNPQSGACAGCPQNEWGSYVNPQTGTKSRACADAKRIAVVAPSQLEKGDAYQLTIPAASMKDFGALMNSLNALSPAVPYNAVVVTVSFDTNMTYPKLLFKPKRYLTDAEYALAKARYNTEITQDVAGLPDAPSNKAANIIATDRPKASIAGTAPAVDDGFDDDVAAAEEAAEKAAAAKAARVAAAKKAAADAAAAVAAAEAEESDGWDDVKPTAAPTATTATNATTAADGDGWDDAPEPAAAATAKPKRTRKSATKKEEPAVIDNATGEVDAVEEAELDDVFGAGWE